MQSATATHVRVFSPDEFRQPPGWPEDVGIAVVRPVGAASEIFPVHRNESGESLLRRIEEVSGLALASAAVHPPVEGHPDCDLSFSTVRDLLNGVEAFLRANPDAVEEADDFAVNFAFAAEEGGDICGPLVPSAPPPLERKTELDGFMRYDPDAAPLRPYPRSVLRLDPCGTALIVLDPLSAPGDFAVPEVLLREDGLAFAVHRDAVEHRPYALRVPPGCLPEVLAGLACDLPLVSSTRSDHLLFSPIAGLAPPRAGACSCAIGARAEVGDTPRARFSGAGFVVTRLRSGRAFAAIGMATLVTAVLFGMAPNPVGVPETPVDALRASLFRAAP